MLLLGEDPAQASSVAQRMSWAATRVTKKVENRAYSLMGLFGVNMPLLYGEREKAFVRLQLWIIVFLHELRVHLQRQKQQKQQKRAKGMGMGMGGCWRRRRRRLLKRAILYRWAMGLAWIVRPG